MSSPSSEPSRRLFLALWPDATLRAQLAGLAAEAAGARQIAAADLHLTLVFLGATPPARRADYEAALAELPTLELELCLDRYGYWPRPGILWLGPQHTPAALLEWVALLHQRLANCGFLPERRPFQAHVTLARRWPGPAPQPAPSRSLCWPVRDTALVESLPQPHGARYRVLRRWPGD
jgi:2'-5' RNA ligase